MSDFRKQYDKELRYQEEKSNQYTLKGVVLFIATELVMCALLSYHAVLLYVVPLLFAAHYRQKKTLWLLHLFCRI